MFLYGVRSSNFTVSGEVGDAVKFTAYGAQVLDEVQANADLNRSEARFVVFLLFYQEELFVDVEASDRDVLLKELAQAIDRRDLTIPWIFDHILYDAAFELLPDRPEKINATQTEELLRKAPPGVSQVGHYVTGPFGLLTSAASRYFPPPLRLLLCHCADAACAALHEGSLTQAEARITEASARPGEPSTLASVPRNGVSSPRESSLVIVGTTISR